MALLSRSSMEGAVDLIVMGLAACIVLLSGFAIVVVLPLLLFVSAVGPNGWIGGWWSGLWLAAAWFAAFYGVVKGIEIINRPALGAMARLAGLYMVIAVACPMLWIR